MGRWGPAGEQIPTTLFEAAAFWHAIKARCPCGHEAVFHAAALWWLFRRKGWRDHLTLVPKRMRCTRCGRRGVPIEAVRDEPTIANLPLPSDADWKRAVSRFRA